MKITKKQWWIVGGVVGVVSLGAVIYFFSNPNGAHTDKPRLPNGIEVDADKNSTYYKALVTFSKDKSARLQLVTQLLQLMSEFFVDDDKVMELITRHLPDDQYMKIFRHTFYFHTYKPMVGANQEWDLRGWFKNRLKDKHFELLVGRYPSLSTHIKK